MRSLRLPRLGERHGILRGGVELAVAGLHQLAEVVFRTVTGGYFAVSPARRSCRCSGCPRRDSGS